MDLPCIWTLVPSENGRSSDLRSAISPAGAGADGVATQSSLVIVCLRVFVCADLVCMLCCSELSRDLGQAPGQPLAVRGWSLAASA